MKYILTLIALICFTSAQSQAKAKLHFGTHNLIIGPNAAANIRNESYCIIVGGKSKFIKGKDMQWAVDYSEPFLLPSIANLLKSYEKKLGTKSDTHAGRIRLIKKIIYRGSLNHYYL